MTLESLRFTPLLPGTTHVLSIIFAHPRALILSDGRECSFARHPEGTNIVPVAPFPRITGNRQLPSVIQHQSVTIVVDVVEENKLLLPPGHGNRDTFLIPTPGGGYDSRDRRRHHDVRELHVCFRPKQSRQWCGRCRAVQPGGRVVGKIRTPLPCERVVHGNNVHGHTHEELKAKQGVQVCGSCSRGPEAVCFRGASVSAVFVLSTGTKCV